MKQHGSKYFARRFPPPTLGMGLKGRNSTFSDHGLIAYHIKWNHESLYMVANILPAYSLDPGGEVQKVKIQLFQNMVMLHIKLKGITNV